MGTGPKKGRKWKREPNERGVVRLKKERGSREGAI